MNERLFLLWILNEIEQSPAASPRTIIRLRETANCSELARELRQRLGAHPASSSIEPLPLINSLSCPVRPSQELLNSPCVEGAETDPKPAFVHSHYGGLPSGDSAPQSRFSLGSKPFTPWGIRRIGAPQAWRSSTGDRIKIGVIDTGIDYSHPDLQGSIGGGINLVHRHLPPTDDNGHGTHISGTIAASSRRGMRGVAPHAEIYAVKAFDHNGSSYVTDIVRGIDWCVRNRMHLINMSFGMKNRSPALEAAVRNAAREGVIIVASAGNEGKRGFVDYPARFPQTIAVGATTRLKRIAPFSNKGVEIDIYAPGEKITSTWLNGQYQELSGTSMATSHVSGVIALLLAVNPRITPKVLTLLLQKHATPLETRARKAGFLGEVNAIRTLKAFSKGRRSRS